MLSILRSIALTGLVLSFCVHLLSWIWPTAISHIPGIMLLHLPVVLFGFPTIIYYAKTQKKYQDAIQSLEEQALPPLPYIITKPVIFIIIYAFINIAISAAFPLEGVPTYVDGEYYFYDHGKIIRQITRHEYLTAKYRELRSFANGWLIGYSIEFELFRYCIAIRKYTKLLRTPAN